MIVNLVLRDNPVGAVYVKKLRGNHSVVGYTKPYHLTKLAKVSILYTYNTMYISSYVLINIKVGVTSLNTTPGMWKTTTSKLNKPIYTL